MRTPDAVIGLALAGLALLVALPAAQDLGRRDPAPTEVEVEIEPSSWVPVPVPIPGYAFGYGFAPLGPAGPHGPPPRSSATVTTRASDGRTTRTLRVRSGDPRGSGVTETITPRWPADVVRAVERLSARPDAAAAMRDGAAAFRARDFARAAERYRRAVPLDPDNGLPRLQLAIASFALADHEAAARSLRRALELLPSWPAAGPDLAALYVDPRDLDDHLASLRAHVRQRPDDADARLVLAAVLLLRGERDAAARALEALPEDDAAAAALRDELRRRRPR